MKAVLPILAGLALVACKGEPAPAGDQATDAVENATDAMSDTAEKAQKVSLSIAGMT